MRIPVFAALLALAACGVESPPEPPEAPPAGVSIGGDLRLGVSGEI